MFPDTALRVKHVSRMTRIIKDGIRSCASCGILGNLWDELVPSGKQESAGLVLGEDILLKSSYLNCLG